MVIGVLHAAAWAVVVPSFQGPDEIVQFAYVEEVAGTGLPPDRQAPYALTPPDVDVALSSLPWSTTGDPNWSKQLSQAARRDLEGLPFSVSDGQSGYQAANPPLYGYYLAPVQITARALGADVYDRLLALRLGTALLMAIIVGGVFLFLRELLPRHPLAWTVGALAVALQPMLGFVAGTVNNDVPVYAAGAVLLWGIARAFRRGLDRGTGMLIAGAILAGVLSKVSAYGLTAAAVLPLVVLLLRRPAGRRARTASGALVLTVGVGLVWYLVQGSRSLVPIAGDGSGAALPSTGESSFVVREWAGYVWQYWFPRLPFMDDQFTAYPDYGLWDIYLQAFTGRFGWFQFGFGPQAAIILTVLLVVAAGLAVVAARRRDWLRGRRLELLAYLGMAVVFAVFINTAGYGYRKGTGTNFEQVRYLFPLIGFYGALIATAVVGAGRRVAPYVAGIVAAGGAAHVFAALLITMERYYT